MYWKESVDNLVSEMMNDAEHYFRAAAAWKAVEIRRTKSGTEFKNLSSALVNCRRINEYGFDRIRVNFRGYRSYYDGDCIDIYGYIDELPENDPRRENTPLAIGGLRTHYILTPDEIRERISLRIDTYTRRANEILALIPGAGEAIKTFRESVENAEETLRSYFPGKAYYAYNAAKTM